MKHTPPILLTVLVSLMTLLSITSSRAVPLGTAFSYAGRLTDNGSPATGNYDLQFILRDADSVGNQVGPILTNRPVTVSNGLFTVGLDFGGAAFDGNARWLEIGVRTNGSVAAYTTLGPLQPVTATPHALYAINAAVAATATGVASNSVTGASIQDSSIVATKLANSQVVKSLNGLTDNVTLSAGANVTVTPSGNNLQISATATGGGGGFQNFQVFDTNGTFTVPAGVTKILVEVWGPGGSGGHSSSSYLTGGGGGGGGYGKAIFAVAPGTNYNVAVGTSDLGISSFDILISATGGQPGGFGGQNGGSSGGTGGAGGTSTAPFNINGATGGGGGAAGSYQTAYASLAGGSGGAAGAGGGGGGGGANTHDGAPGSAPGGGGGGGGAWGTRSGGAGGNGRVVVWY